jgi:hypothetical protein
VRAPPVRSSAFTRPWKRPLRLPPKGGTPDRRRRMKSACSRVSFRIEYDYEHEHEQEQE